MRDVRPQATPGTGPAAAAAYRGLSVLVTGAGGSIGSELCRQIVAAGPRRVVLLETGEHALFEIDRALRARAPEAAPALVPLLGSAGDARLLRGLFARHRVDVVLHAAAYKHVPLVEANVLAGLANNVVATETVAREAAQAGVGRFVLISSDKAVEPVSAMGVTKRLAELAVRGVAEWGGGTRCATVRFGNVIGSSGSVVPIFAGQIAAGGPVTLTDEGATRFFMSVEQAAGLVLFAGARALGGEIFVLEMGEPVRIGDLARRMIRERGLTVRDAANPGGDIAIEIVGLRPGERLHETPITAGARPSGLDPAILVALAAAPSEIEVAHLLRTVRRLVAGGTEAEARAFVAGLTAPAAGRGRSAGVAG